MRQLRKLLIILIILIMMNVRVSSHEIPETYNQPLVELRGAWVSTVSNIDIGKQTSIEQYKQEYTKILDNFERFHMNAVFFQVRPTNDAFYESEINPWSVFLTGQQGKSPGWDPLPWLIEETHKRGMEFHAWLNPYRASLDVFSSKDLTQSQYETELARALGAMDDKNFAKQNPDLLIQGGVRILLNPAKQAVRDHIIATIDEIVEKYDVDAIHFDDYFYTDVQLQKDRALFLSDTGRTDAQYTSGDHKNWRRLQVDMLVEGIHDYLEQFNEKNNRKIQFGISPAAGWAPQITPTCPAFPNGYGMEGGMEGYPCNGYSSFNDLYADTRKWVKEEWLDYILPQNYFELGRYHEEITDWWSRQVEGTSVRLYMGIGLYQYQYYSYLTKEEYINQLRFNQQYENVSGIVIFSYKSMVYPSGQKWAEAVQLVEDYWDTTPLLPASITGSNVESKVDDISVVRRNNQINLLIPTDENAIGYAVYRVGVGQTPDFDLNKIHKLVGNYSDEIKITDTVTNEEVFDYHVKAVLGNGTLSSQTTKVSVSDAFINTAPILKNVVFPASDIFAIRDKFVVSGEVEDVNGDEITLTIDYSTNGGDRFRYNENVTLVDNAFNVQFVLPSAITESGMIRLTVSDGSLSNIQTSQVFIVVSDEYSFIERQFYSTKKKYGALIQSIYGG